jgi:hypothetical protein
MRQLTGDELIKVYGGGGCNRPPSCDGKDKHHSKSRKHSSSHHRSSSKRHSSSHRNSCS